MGCKTDRILMNICVVILAACLFLCLQHKKQDRQVLTTLTPAVLPPPVSTAQ